MARTLGELLTDQRQEPSATNRFKAMGLAPRETRNPRVDRRGALQQGDRRQTVRCPTERCATTSRRCFPRPAPGTVRSWRSSTTERCSTRVGGRSYTSLRIAFMASKNTGQGLGEKLMSPFSHVEAASIAVTVVHIDLRNRCVASLDADDPEDRIRASGTHDESLGNEQTRKVGVLKAPAHSGDVVAYAVLNGKNRLVVGADRT